MIVMSVSLVPKAGVKVQAVCGIGIGMFFPESVGGATEGSIGVPGGKWSLSVLGLHGLAYQTASVVAAMVPTLTRGVKLGSSTTMLSPDLMPRTMDERWT